VAMKNEEKSDRKERSLFKISLHTSFKEKEDSGKIELNMIRQKVAADFAKRSIMKVIEKNPPELKTGMHRNKNFIAILV
jgi:hypothetical protein